VRHLGTEKLHPFLGETVSLGKDRQNTIVLDDPYVSSRHLRITRRGHLFQLVDPGSTNGTFIGPLRIYEALVPLHTQVKIGSAEVTLEPRVPAAPRRSTRASSGAIRRSASSAS
jgi:pSer/pThr/pTyr-binding forkhead associated (FHA) protein